MHCINCNARSHLIKNAMSRAGMAQCIAKLLILQVMDKQAALRSVPGQRLDEVDALPGLIAKVRHGVYPIGIANQKAQHDRCRFPGRLAPRRHRAWLYRRGGPLRGKCGREFIEGEEEAGGLRASGKALRHAFSRQWKA